MDDGITTALAHNGAPVVMADPADNAGGGAPSDNTTILRRLIERNVEDACVGPIWDPIAVRICLDAGVGADHPPALRRQDRAHLRPAHRRDGDGDGRGARLLAELRPDAGAAGRLRRDPRRRVEVVLITNRTQALGLELFTNLGIDPRASEAGRW